MKVLIAAYMASRVGLVRWSTILRQHLDNAENVGRRRYLGVADFIYRSDGSPTPSARVYSLRTIGAHPPGMGLR